MHHDQSGFGIRCEWGIKGVEALAPISDVVIIVDVLSFTTCVDVAVSRGAAVLPYRWKDDSAGEFARRHSAELAGVRGDPAHRFSLSPVSLEKLGPGDRIVLPSPNGSTLTLATGKTPTLSGCLRNARAAAQAANRIGGTVAVIPAGERWPDGGLRPALEDWIGAGAIIAELNGDPSPEARAAVAAFRQASRRFTETLSACGSGRELIARGYESDVVRAAQHDVSHTAPRLTDGAYVESPA